MYKEIYDWVVAVVSDHELKKAQSNLEGRKQKDDYDKTLADLLEAAKEYKANPTWKSYKEFYKLSWAFGHPGERDSVRLFQKMTPEKQKELQERADNRYEYFKERIDNHYERQRRDIAGIQREIADIKKRVQPGVSLKGDEAVKEFPVDLKGWRYNSKDLERRFQRQIDEFVKEQQEAIEFFSQKPEQPDKPGMVEFRRDLIKNMEESIERIRTKDWRSIKVKLTTKPIEGVKASWQERQRILTIIIPHTLRWEGLEGLGNSLRHELQHFAQSYLAFVVDRNIVMQPGLRGRRPGFPSRKIQTPEFQQELRPGHPLWREDNPEVKKLQRKLREQGLRVQQVDIHALDDFEFYTRLADSIEKFKTRWKWAEEAHRKDQKERKDRGEELNPPLEYRTAIKLFTGTIPYPDLHTRDWHERMKAFGGYAAVDKMKPSEFFKALKRSAPGKYRKALSEFVNAVT